MLYEELGVKRRLCGFNTKIALSIPACYPLAPFT
ncbi:hypothetical protein SAMN05216428_1097 [Nitrosospira sp. Nsp11]|nr:hypothetical protein SAMN05216428_1097 [Nitrosospira sp. Nsp11]